MKRSEAVIEAAQHLTSAEAAIEEAYGVTAALASKLMSLRRAAGLSGVIGQEAITSLTATLESLSTARGGIVRTHADLLDVKVQIGCRTVASGGEDCPDNFMPTRASQAKLAVVA